MNAFVQLQSVGVTYPFRDPALDSLRGQFARWLRPASRQAQRARPLDVQALRGIDLQLGEGERVGLIGPNGSGKSTLLKVLAGVLPPTRGQVQVRGRVHAIFDPALGMDPEASGLENIRIRCMLMRVPSRQIDARCREIAQFCELGLALRRPIKTYSAGMSMRLAFAIATAVEPEILVMDEWLSAGDARFVAKALARMEVLVRASRLLVLASHSEHLLLQWCTRLLWFDQGRVVADGAPAQVLAEYRAALQPEPVEALA